MPEGGACSGFESTLSMFISTYKTTDLFTFTKEKRKTLFFAQCQINSGKKVNITIIWNRGIFWHMVMMMMMNYFCGMVNRRKAVNFVFRQDHCQRFSPSRIFDMPRAGFEPAKNLSSGFVEWSCAVVITTTPRRQYYLLWDFHKYDDLR